MDFQSILLELHSILDRAKSLVKEYESKLRSVNERESLAEQRHHALDDRHEGMQAREAACQKVENIQKLHADATAMHNAAHLRLNEAVEAERKNRLYFDTENQKLKEKAILTKREADNVLTQRKGIDDEVNQRVKQVLKNMGLNPDSGKALESKQA